MYNVHCTCQRNYNYFFDDNFLLLLFYKYLSTLFARIDNVFANLLKFKERYTHGVHEFYLNTWTRANTDFHKIFYFFCTFLVSISNSFVCVRDIRVTIIFSFTQFQTFVFLISKRIVITTNSEFDIQKDQQKLSADVCFIHCCRSTNSRRMQCECELIAKLLLNFKFRFFCHPLWTNAWNLIGKNNFVESHLIKHTSVRWIS